MLLRWVLFSMLLCMGAMLTSCGRYEEFRYRMTVEVETPQGLRAGSGVIEVKLSDPGWGGMPTEGTSARVRGEAVTVDLPGGRVLFALLRSPFNYDAAAVYPYDALKPSRYRGEYALVERTKEMKRIRGAGVLPEKSYPRLVTFDDLADPASVRLVDSENLAATFGEGVRLRRITVQITHDPVTAGIEQKLPWLRSHRGTLKPNPPMFLDDPSDPDLLLLGTGSFSTEIFE